MVNMSVSCPHAFFVGSLNYQVITLGNKRTPPPHPENLISPCTTPPAPSKKRPFFHFDQVENIHGHLLEKRIF